MAREMADEIAFYKVDGDAFPQLKAKYAPRGFPTYVFFYDGKVIDSHPGAFRDITDLKAWLRECQMQGEEGDH